MNQVQPGKEVIKSLFNLRQELVDKRELGSVSIDEMVLKINSCLFKVYPPIFRA